MENKKCLKPPTRSSSKLLRPQLQMVRISTLDILRFFDTLAVWLRVVLTFVQQIFDDSGGFYPNQPESTNPWSILEEMVKLNESLLLSLGKCLSLRINIFKPHAIANRLIHILYIHMYIENTVTSVLWQEQLWFARFDDWSTLIIICQFTHVFLPGDEECWCCWKAVTNVRATSERFGLKRSGTQRMECFNKRQLFSTSSVAACWRRDEKPVNFHYQWLPMMDVNWNVMGNHGNIWYLYDIILNGSIRFSVYGQKFEGAGNKQWKCTHPRTDWSPSQQRIGCSLHLEALEEAENHFQKNMRKSSFWQTMIKSI